MRLSDLYREYRDQIEFLVIYIREAHPVDGWWFGKGLPRLFFMLTGSKAAMDIYDPVTLEERQSVAKRCETVLEHGIQTLVDEMDDDVNKAYAALPTRMYLIGVDGRVVYAGGLGPFGFKPKEMKRAIEAYLEQG